MLDFRHLPPASLLNTTVFYAAQSTTTTNTWQVWAKPRGCSLISILAIGAGGGGARPAQGTGNGGGGGGSSGCLARLLIPAQFLPDLLYVRVGNGGAGATANSTAGTAGTNSYVMLQPGPVANNAYNLITLTGGGAGNIPTGGGTAATASIGNQALFGISTILAALGGGNGGAAAGNNNGTSITFLSATGQPPLTGGAGGGSTNGSATNGGGITVTNSFPFSSLSGGAGRGPDGYGYNKRIDPNNPNDLIFAFTGGCGGGAVTSGTAGAGGVGGYGCGGGGGGGATTTNVTGNGGNGGDGLVLISAW